MLAASSASPAPDARVVRRRVERRWLRTLRIGLAPVVAVFGILVLLLINAIPFIEAIAGYSVSLETEITGRLTACVVALFLLQAVALWILGVAGSILSRQALTSGGYQLQQRLALLSRRFAFMAWAVFSLRILALLVLVIGFILTMTTIFGLNVISDIGSSIWLDARYQPVAVGLSAFIGLVIWIFGPFLRLRYSMAIGALAATWSRRRDEQFWLTISARLLIEMLGILTLVWTISLLNLLTYITFDPLPGAGSPNSLPAIIGMLPFETIGGSSWLGALFVGSLYIIGQLGLPIVYTRIARWRLRRRALLEAVKSTASWSPPTTVSDSVSTAG